MILGRTIDVITRHASHRARPAMWPGGRMAQCPRTEEDVMAQPPPLARARRRPAHGRGAVTRGTSPDAWDPVLRPHHPGSQGNPVPGLLPAHARGDRGVTGRARPPAGQAASRGNDRSRHARGNATKRCEEVVLSRRTVSSPKPQPAGGSHAHPSRRDFLKKAGTAGVMLGSGSALLSACSNAAGVGGGSQTSKGTIKILLWSHFVPRYDTWFDPWAKKWGQQNGVNVVVDHINQADLPARTAAEFAAGTGHDMIEWITPASAYEPSVHDLTDVVMQAEAKYGNQLSFCRLSSFNPHTSKYYAFCHTWTPDPGDYRKGLWAKAG